MLNLLARTRSIPVDRWATALGAFADPLAYLRAEHGFHLDLCRNLEDLALHRQASTREDSAGQVAEYLRVELPLHEEDEEGGLLPFLQLRATAEDRPEEMLVWLQADHADKYGFTMRLLPALDAIALGGAPEEPTAFEIEALAFAELLRHHLKWENANVIPLAERRLTPVDLRRIGEEMAHRRRIWRSY